MRRGCLLLIGCLLASGATSAAAWTLDVSLLQPPKATLLHEELVVALGLPAELIRVESDGARRVRVTLPDSVARAAVEAVLAAHDPTRLSAAEVGAAKVTTAQTAIRLGVFPSASDIDARVELLFPDPVYTDVQRMFFKRLAKLVLGLIQERRLDE